MSPDMKVEIKRSDGKTEYRPVPQNTFYLGKVTSEPGSMVAVSNSEGMVRAQFFSFSLDSTEIKCFFNKFREATKHVFNTHIQATRCSLICNWLRSISNKG